MKNYLGMIAALLIAIAFFGTTDALGAKVDDDDEVDRAWKGSQQTRTWVVVSVPDGSFPLKPGDAFRLVKSGFSTRLFPLATLQKSWNIGSDVSIELEKTRGERKFCARLDYVERHDEKTDHYLILYPPGKGLRAYDMRLDIITRDVNETPFSCDELQIHGGMAHAQN